MKQNVKSAEHDGMAYIKYTQSGCNRMPRCYTRLLRIPPSLRWTKLGRPQVAAEGTRKIHLKAYAVHRFDRPCLSFSLASRRSSIYDVANSHDRRAES